GGAGGGGGAGQRGGAGGARVHADRRTTAHGGALRCDPGGRRGGRERRARGRCSGGDVVSVQLWTARLAYREPDALNVTRQGNAKVARPGGHRGLGLFFAP